MGGTPEEAAVEKDMIERALADVIAGFDGDGSGTLTITELNGILQDKKMKKLLAQFGLDVKEVEILFSMLSTVGKRRGLTVDEIVTGLMKVKGVATNQDILACRLDLSIQAQAIIDNILFLENYLCLLVPESLEEANSGDVPRFAFVSVSTCQDVCSTCH